MEDGSIFMDKELVPNEKKLFDVLGPSHLLWKEIRNYVHGEYPAAKDEWKFSGLKHGWNFRIQDRKRVIVYLLPRDGFFKVAFVFGQKATDMILKSDISDVIKSELRSAKVYAEGRGIRIEVKKKVQLKDIKFLVDTKLAK